MTQSELNEILEKHEKWLSKEEGGEKADLSGADLRHADLSGADLEGVDFYRADLCWANLRAADLREANLRKADLYGADLRWANLCGADLRDANIGGADVRDAKLSEANLSGTIGDINTAFFALCCPEKGAFIGFKEARGKIVELLIPEDAQRSSATTRKCRCSKAKVLSITEINGTDSGLTEIPSTCDSGFIYKVGETVSVSDFDEDRWNECSTGIHFFITRDEAVNYIIKI